MGHWSESSVFYHLFPLGLLGAPERNPLSGAPSRRLPELLPWVRHARDLGANALFLGPVFESATHGYDVVDPLRVDRRLGEASDLRQLVDEAHGLGMRVILDAVFGHVGRGSAIFQDLQARGPASRFSGWLRGLRFDLRSPWGDRFAYEGWKGCLELPRLDLDNPEVRDHQLACVERWRAEYGIDGLRLDTADWLAPAFLTALRERCERLDPAFWLMGEVVHGDYRQWANPRALHSVTNYECSKGLWSSLADRNLFEIAYSLERQFGPRGLYRGLPLYAFADNHDVNRAASNLKERAHLFPLYCLLFAMPGVPSIYYGSEWGLEGRRTERDDRALRPRLDLEALRRGEQDLARAIRRLAGLRAATRALQAGDYRPLFVASEQLAFVREVPGESVLVAVNAAAGPARLELTLPRPAAGPLPDLLNPGDVAEGCGTRLCVQVPPRWARVLRLS